MIFVFNNLISFIKNNKAIFCLLIITQIITLIGVFTTYNYYAGLFAQTRQVHEEARTYRVYSPDKKDLTAKFEKLIGGKYAVQHTYTFTTSEEIDISANENDNEQTQNASTNQNKIKYFCGDYYGETALIHKMNVGYSLTKNDHKNATNSIVLSGGEYHRFSVGENYIINDKEYKVIGISTGDYYYIPYETFMKDGLPVSGVDVVLKGELDNAGEGECAAYLKELFGAKNVELPAEGYGEEMSKYNFIFVFCGLMFSLSIINFVYLYSYILDKRKRQYAVFRIFGCSKLRGSLIYAAECLIIAVATYLLTVLIYIFGCEPLLRLIDKYTVSALDISNFVFTFVLYIIVLLCVVVPTIIKYAKKEIVSQYRN